MALKDKKVLDIGAGNKGQFVLDLRSLGVDAYGVDLKAGTQRRFSTSRHLARGDASTLPFKDEQFDVAYSYWNIFFEMYMKKESDEFLISVLKEVKRVLKVGGVFRIAPYHSGKRLEKLLEQVPGLEITPETQGLSAIELKRTR